VTLAKKTSKWLQKISHTWLMVASLMLMVLFMIFVLPAQAEKSTQEIGSERSPDTSFYYTPDGLYQIAEEYGAAGRQAYIRARWTFDLIFPLVYTIFLAVGISWFNQRIAGWHQARELSNLVPILGGIFDLLENSAASLAMSLYPEKVQIVLVSASLFTPVKWILVSLSFILYFVVGIAWLIQRIRS
jgi:hypothetical protein